MNNFDEITKDFVKWLDTLDEDSIIRIQQKEIERLHQCIKDDKENADEIISEQGKEIERLNKELEFEKQIKKEVREYIDQDIKSNYFKRYDDEVYKLCDDLLEILGKVEEKK